MIKRQLKDICACLLAGACAGGFGFLLGFYDYQGRIYFDIYGARNMFLIFFLGAFIACLIEKLKQYKK